MTVNGSASQSVSVNSKLHYILKNTVYVLKPLIFAFVSKKKKNDFRTKDFNSTIRTSMFLSQQQLSSSYSLIVSNFIRINNILKKIQT